jgi:HD-like signal output (HDOD) protein
MQGTSSTPTWLRILSEFLTQRGVLNADQLSSVQSFHAGIDRRIGQLALLKGYVTLKQVFAILGVSAQDNLRFGEAAVRQGVMTEPQVEEVLTLQKNPSDLFLQCLVFAEVVEPSRLPPLMEDLRKFLGDRNRAPAAPLPAAPPADEGERVGKEEVRTVLKRIKSIGTLPMVVQKIIAMTEDPNCEMRALAKTVTADPNLTAQLLRVVNSAALGASRKFSNATDAISRIGVKGLRNVALATAVLDRFQGSDKEGMRKIWMHSVLTSQWAQALVTVRKDRYPAEDAFIAGLIHDIGETVLRQFFPDSAALVDRRVREGRATAEVEREAFGQTHEDAGAYLCDLWSFPAATTQAVAYHHAPLPILKALPDLQPLTVLVNGACRLADLALDPDDAVENRLKLESLEPEFRAFHKIDGSLADLFPPIYARSREMSAWLG